MRNTGDKVPSMLEWQRKLASCFDNPLVGEAGMDSMLGHTQPQQTAWAAKFHLQQRGSMMDSNRVSVASGIGMGHTKPGERWQMQMIG